MTPRRKNGTPLSKTNTGNATDQKRIGIFGWGVNAPQSADVNAFEQNLQRSDTWMTPFKAYGPNNFLVGQPTYSEDDIKQWIEARFKPARYTQFAKHSGETSRYAASAFIQALQQNPGIEQCLQELGTEAHIYLGTGLGDLPTTYDVSVDYYKAQRRWNRFWGNAKHCAVRAEYEALDSEARAAYSEANAVPADPRSIDDDDKRDTAAEPWEQHWCEQSEQLLEYLAEARDIQCLAVSEKNGGKGSVIKGKMVAMRRLNARWGCPTEPWAAVDPKLIWNIHNAPAAQVSMLGQITGPAIAPVGACASFGVALKLAWNAIQQGDAKAVVVGMVDPSPHPLLVGAFYRANVLSGDGDVCKPLQGMKGTHIAGGSCVWIVGDADYLQSKGFTPVGMEIVGVGLSSDANHIITPSLNGPLASINNALDQAAIEPSELSGWDMHCTATPGDTSEVAMMQQVIPKTVAKTARKGSFGHGMSVGGGWELTAQHMGAAAGELAATTLAESELSDDIAAMGDQFVFNQPQPIEGDYFGKINMGVGGINACVISRRWKAND